MAKETKQHRSSRREFVKKAAYIAPAILTLEAAPAYAKAGSKDTKPPKGPKPPKPRKPGG
jgi:hypothetical protein